MSRLRQAISRLVQETRIFLDGGYFCEWCGARLSGGESVLCARCLANELIPSRLLPHTGNGIESAFQDEGVGIFFGWSAFAYLDGCATRQFIIDIKFRDQNHEAVFLGRLIGDRMKNLGMGDGFDCIIPVPTHKLRLRQRGYNQAERIAVGVGERLGLPVRGDVLWRSIYAASQVGCKAVERRMAIRGAFSLQKNPAEYDGLRAIIFDDVYTTGATLMECARTLKQIPNSKIAVVTAAIKK